MKPPPFAYTAPRTLDAALEALAEPGAKVLAGGQSLIPLLNMRLAAPARLVDVNGVAGLGALEATAAGVRAGALVRHAAAGRSEGAARVQPLLRRAVRHVAHPAIRNRGTVVGSLAHADPAAELPAVLAVLGGTVEAASVRGRRTIPADAFFAGPLEPALAPDELAVSAFFPAAPPRSGSAFAETSRRHGDYALAGVAVTVALGADGTVRSARAGYLGVGATPLVLDLTSVAAEGACAAAFARENVDPDGDVHASADYRRHLAGVLTDRALREATAEALAAARPDGHNGDGGGGGAG